MKSTLLYLFILSLLIQSCDDGKFDETESAGKGVDTEDYKNTRGYFENGKIISEFDCPDAVHLFPPIDLLIWDKTPAVNGRLPTYEETTNGTAIAHYGGKEKFVKPCNIRLPRLAYRLDPVTKTKNYLVVAIQMVRTESDTVVGYRYLTGGCGGSSFGNFYFLNEKETKELISKKILI